MASIFGRSIIVPLTNKSGGPVVLGDVVVVDTTTDESFTTTTSAASTSAIGIAAETIANNAVGRIIIGGYASLVNVNAAVTRNQFGTTHTVAKQAVASATRVPGTFCRWLKSSATPSAYIYPVDLSAGALTDHTHAATGTGATGGGATLSPTTLNVPGMTPAATEGQLGMDTTNHGLTVYDTQRARGVGHRGWAPSAAPLHWDSGALFSTALNLAANGGSVAIPIEVKSQMLTQTVVLWNTDTASARAWRWDLYVQRLNNGNGGENTLDRVATSNVSESFTASAASVRLLADASAPTYLPPGIYWLVIQNTHATNTFGLGSTAMPLGLTSLGQTKTTSNPNGATLDFVAATWSKTQVNYGALISGRVHGNTTAW